jgi:hypothetical protein
MTYNMPENGCIRLKHVGMTDEKERIKYDGIAVTMHPLKHIQKLH